MRIQLYFALLAVALGAGLRAQSPGLWERMLESDRDADGRISRDEFRGPVGVFERMDADGNGVLEKSEIQQLMAQRRGRAGAGEEAQESAPGKGGAPHDAFAAMDRNGDGKVTSDEMIDHFLDMDTDGDGMATRAEYEALLQRQAQQQAQQQAEARAHREAAVGPPEAGDQAPDFTLPVLGSAGKEQPDNVSLSSLRGKPVLLIFGSYT